MHCIHGYRQEMESFCCDDSSPFEGKSGDKDAEQDEEIAIVCCALRSCGGTSTKASAQKIAFQAAHKETKTSMLQHKKDATHLFVVVSPSNGGLFQRLSGFETGHPAAAGPLPAFDSSVSDEQDAAFLVSVMHCSDCDSSGLDSPNSSWSMARLKEYLRRKKRPSKREKSRASWTWLSPLTSSPRILFFFFFFFFSLYLFLFSSSPACYASYFSSIGTQPDKYCFTFSAILFECTLCVQWPQATSRVGPLDWRILHELHFACAATFRVPPAFDREWFHHLANGSQLHAFSQGRAFVYFVVHAHSIGDRRTETSSYVRKKKSLSFFLPLSLSLSLSLSLFLSLSPCFFVLIFVYFYSYFFLFPLLKKKRKEKLLTSPKSSLCVRRLFAKKEEKKKHRWHCICFQEATSFPCFAMIGSGRVHRLLGTRRKVKIFRRKRSLHRTGAFAHAAGVCSFVSTKGN